MVFVYHLGGIYIFLLYLVLSKETISLSTFLLSSLLLLLFDVVISGFVCSTLYFIGRDVEDTDDLYNPWNWDYFYYDKEDYDEGLEFIFMLF